MNNGLNTLSQITAVASTSLIGYGDMNSLMQQHCIPKTTITLCLPKQTTTQAQLTHEQNKNS